ncbi:MAG: 50S ribosomal protein L32 [Candidatus Shapirobacteria bacterium]|nr:50S ribosomal protein L32 [Candidatus Shapirobacteria bacterium]
MTALPKHRPSSRRQGKRRATHSVTLTNQVVKCRHCGQNKLSGFICGNCQKS